MKALSIAVVDDEAPVRTALRRLLRLAGYDVATFDGGAEFLASLASLVPDCVVLDVHMPEPNGFDVCARLDESGWNTPVVFITASDDPDLDAAVRRCGAAALLRKPFSGDALLAAVEAALGTKPKAS